MDNKSELFDLKREKQELDNFLSTIADTEAPASLPIKSAVQTKEALSSFTEKEYEPEPSPQEPSELQLEAPEAKPEKIPELPFYDKEDTQSFNEFIPKFATPEAVSLKLDKKTVSEQEKPSLSDSLDEEKKVETLPKITDARGVKPLETLKTMTRFDGTTKFEGQVAVATPKQAERIILPEIETEKKITKANPYDFAPEKKKTGKGKWIWILIILIVALLVGYFWLYPERGSKTIEIIRSYIPGTESLFKPDQGSTSSSAVNLINVRQRLIHNVTLGKSIRIIEGVAANSAPYEISKIKITAHLYDSQGALLASMESYGGNILIDDQLENLDAAGLVSALKEGKTSEDRIPPKGQIPFMIVFTDEPAGVFKLSVLPVDFKKH